MIGAILKKVARAAVAQPWEYMGEGAPADWEFRVSPDEGYLAVYDPHVGVWRMLRADDLSVCAEATLTEMDRNAADWAQYVEVIDED